MPQNELREQQEKEHVRKFEQFAQRLGIQPLGRIVPFGKAVVRAALKAGDAQLNTLAQHGWETMHYAVKQLAKVSLENHEPWPKSYTVDVLKHVAIHHTKEVSRA